MNRDLDIFVCGGTQHVDQLVALLARLRPHGNVHLGSSFLTEADLGRLRGLYDVLHQPRHHCDAYCNFELFSIRDINKLATAPHFVKLDADVELAADWADYVDECLAAYPRAALFGPQQGSLGISIELSGPLVRQMLDRDLRVIDAPKVIGGFYVCDTEFFQRHRRFMDLVHEFVWCFRDGVRIHPSPSPDHWPTSIHSTGEPIRLTGRVGTLEYPSSEDTLRNFVVHALGAGDRLHVIASKDRVRIRRDNCRPDD